MSSQVAQYRLLENAENVLTQTTQILEKIANISREIEDGGGAPNNVTNYTIEPVWLNSITVVEEGATSVSTTPGQAYFIKARINDLEYVGQLMQEITLSGENNPKANVNITSDVIEGCVLAGGKLYKADTLELIPVAVDVANKCLTLLNFAIVPLAEVVYYASSYPYNPKTNTIGTEGAEDKRLSQQITLSRGDKLYYASIGTTTIGDEEVYYVYDESGSIM